MPPPGAQVSPDAGLRKARGNAAEALAADYLVRQGLRLLARNWRVRGGEIDLICADGATLVFVEVRLRCSDAYGGAAASITTTKQQRLIIAARHYLQRHRRSCQDRACRFDAVLLDALDEANLRWVKNAFALS